MRMESNHEKKEQRETYFLYFAIRYIRSDAVPFFLDGPQFLYDKPGNYDGTYPMASQPL